MGKKNERKKVRPQALVVLATLASEGEGDSTGAITSGKVSRAFSAAVKGSSGVIAKVDVKTRKGQPERGRGGGRPLSGEGLDRLRSLQSSVGIETQDGHEVVCWKINDNPRNFIEWLVAFDPSIEAGNVDFLPAKGSMPAVYDLVQAPLEQYRFMPNHIVMSDQVRFRIEIEHLVTIDRLKYRDLMVLKEAGELVAADIAAMDALLSKAIRSLNKAMWELGYHIRTNSSQRRLNRFKGNDVNIEYVLRRPCWNTNARASARFGKSGLGNSLHMGYGSPSSRGKSAPVESAPVESVATPLVVTAETTAPATATIATQTVE